MIPDNVIDLECQQDPLVSGCSELNEKVQARISEETGSHRTFKQDDDEDSEFSEEDHSPADLSKLLHLAYVKEPRCQEKHPECGRCDFCATDSTPMWRRGPKGCGTLCNACGVKWKNALIRAGILPPKGRLPKSPNKFEQKKWFAGGAGHQHLSFTTPNTEHREHAPVSSGGYFCRYCNTTFPKSHFKNTQQFGAHCSNCSRKNKDVVPAEKPPKALVSPRKEQQPPAPTGISVQSRELTYSGSATIKRKHSDSPVTFAYKKRLSLKAYDEDDEDDDNLFEIDNSDLSDSDDNEDDYFPMQPCKQQQAEIQLPRCTGSIAKFGVLIEYCERRLTRDFAQQQQVSTETCKAVDVQGGQQESGMPNFYLPPQRFVQTF